MLLDRFSGIPSCRLRQSLTIGPHYLVDPSSLTDPASRPHLNIIQWTIFPSGALLGRYDNFRRRIGCRSLTPSFLKGFCPSRR